MPEVAERPGWSIVAGRFDSRIDQVLMDEGRRRHHSHRGCALRTDTPVEPPRSRFHGAFVAHKDPWRLAIITEGPGGSLGSGPAGTTSVSAWASAAWVALEGEPLTVVGDTRGEGTSPYDFGLRAMLQVGWLKSLVSGTLGPKVDIAPERMLDLMRTDEWPYSLALIALGASRQSFSYRNDADVLTAMTVTIDDAVAWEIRLDPLHML